MKSQHAFVALSMFALLVVPVLHKPNNAVRGIKQNVAIRYSLDARADSVRLEILDAQSRVIRTLRGNNTNMKVGTHRVLWDMREEPATTFAGLGTRNVANGPRVLPGNYRVRLIVDKHPPLTQRFAITTDPRKRHVSSADIRAQYELAVQARDRLSQVNAAVFAIRDIKSQVDDRVAKAKDAKFEHGARMLKDKLTQVESELYQASTGNPAPAIHSMTSTGKLAAVIAAVDSVEGRPLPKTYEAFSEVSARVDQQINWLDQIFTNDIPQFNQQFINWKKLEPIERRNRE